MNISNPSNNIFPHSSAISSASEGLDQQLQRLQRNVEEVAQGNAANTDARDRALVEQNEIVQNARANARSLEVANQMVGSIIDIKV